MINLDTIEQEIMDLTKHDTTYATIERLAWLYIVRDHMIQPKQTGTFTGSEFCEACSGVQMDSLMQIMSDHMSELQALYPAEYKIIMSKIQSI